MKLTLIPVFIVLLLNSTAQARVTNSRDSDSRGSFWGKKHFINLVVENWKYREPGLMQDEGLLYGLNYAFKNNAGAFFYEANVEYIQGTTTYDGATFSGIPISADQSNRVFMTQFWVGIQTGQSSSVKVIPKVGLLYRRLVDLDDDAAGDYQRDQDYLTIPVGMDLFFPVGSGKLVLNTFITLIFQGTNKTYLTDVGGSQDLTFDQDTGMGWHIGLDYMLETQSQMGWIFSAYARGWEVDDSDFGQLPETPGTSYYEPENNTISIGLKTGITF